MTDEKGELQAMTDEKNVVAAQPASIQAQIVVRDKDGNVKYAGPLNMQVVMDERKEDGHNPSNGG